MLKYRPDLKAAARRLRTSPTDSEAVLWSRLRRKQVLGVQFYRQKPIGSYVVDFFAPAARLVVEVDGSQHLKGDQAQKDAIRDASLGSLGLKVLRFNGREVLEEPGPVMEAIYRVVVEQLKSQIPPGPPFSKGGMGSERAGGVS